jgi:hypothetical protein
MLTLDGMGLPFPFNPQFSGLRRSHCSSMNISSLITTLTRSLANMSSSALLIALVVNLHSSHFLAIFLDLVHFKDLSIRIGNPPHCVMFHEAR